MALPPVSGVHVQGFADRAATAHYVTNGPRRQVPGYDSLLQMADLLLAQSLPEHAQILVIGAGGGLEMAQFAQAHPGWHLTGIDPSAAMLDLARQTLGPLAQQTTMVQGYTCDAPPGPFDGATCILVLHFVPRAERLATLQAIRARLSPKAPFVCAHFSVPGDAAERALWFSRYAAFSIAQGTDPDRARAGALKIAADLPVLSPDQDEADLTAAGFTKVRPFYHALTFRGWIAYAP